MRKIGIIPFDVQNKAFAVLFVTSMARGRWILPKGNIKKSEHPFDAIHREAFEEAGVKGTILEDFPITVTISKKTKNGLELTPVTYYPYLVEEQFDAWPEDHKRQRHWTLIEQAHRAVHRADFLRLLNAFSELRPWITEAAWHNRAPQQLKRNRAQ